jgi:hypothetical protein
MGLISISGQAGCRFEEVARIAARQLGFDLITESRMEGLIRQEFGDRDPLPPSAHGDVVASVIAGLAVQHHLVFCGEIPEALFTYFPGMLRVHIVAPESVRAGNLMLDRHLERPAARQALLELERLQQTVRRQRFGKARLPAHLVDLILNAEYLAPEQLSELIENAANLLGIIERGFLPLAAEAQLQFRIRLRLARHGILPSRKVGIRQHTFSHPSEQIFANLLDFYRINWDYEPRSFPIQWDRDGNVSEAFTPDFYLSEFDLYVELTTMKQSLVTRKNRKVRLLRELYPHINIQVFYQKDFENLIFKYGLPAPVAQV